MFIGWKPMPRAFSLIEIVLALGIISFALVGIMGLFPVAMKSAQESQRETRAALIARQVFSDLGTLPGTNRFLIISDDPADRISINLATSSSNSLYFNAAGFPIGTVPTADALFLANVIVTPNTPVAGLSHVQTTVQTPATTTNHSSYTFVTLMNQQ